MEAILLLNQQIRDCAIGNLHAHIGQQVTDFRFAHQAAIGKHDHERVNARAKLADVARGQRRTIALLGGRRIPYFLAEAHIIGTNEDVLDDHVFIALEDGIRRQRGRVNCQWLLAVDLDWGAFPTLATFNPSVAFGFGRIVCWWARWGRRFDVWLALFTLQAIDVVTQALDFRLGLTQGRGLIGNDIEQTYNHGPHALIRDTAQIKIVQQHVYPHVSCVRISIPECGQPVAGT